MGKSSVSSWPSDALQTTRPRSAIQFTALAVTLVALFHFCSRTDIWALLSHPDSRHNSGVSNETREFRWDELSAKPYLDYSGCYNGFQCAKLELSMDYWNDTTDANISLAVIRLPAVVPITDPQYGGAVLLNPGGPGGSGIYFILASGLHVRETIDSADGKYYDLISFDPRGVGETKPNVECMKNLELDHSWQVRVKEEGVFESSDAAFGRLWSMSIAHGRSCALPLPDGGPDVRRYVTTASVARDMLEIVENHGEWREKEATRSLQLAYSKARRTVPEVPEALRYRRGEEKIQYWGFSYGTYLGNTFAAMFPDRVYRIVVDGVVNAYNYVETLWSDNLLDTEKDLNQFYYHCARVGYPACSLANNTGETTAQGVSDRVANITNSLYHNPLPVIRSNPEVITYSDVKNLIFAGLYSPANDFPFIANTLAALERGDGQQLAKLLESYHDFSCPRSAGSGFSMIPLRSITKSAVLALSYDATMAISCSDGADQSWVNKTAFAQYFKELATISPSIGSMWSTIRMHCIHYGIRPVYRFVGPWKAKTSHPLLLIGNTADPVTPVKHARDMAKGFEGAVALTQDSPGHCSLSAYSNCTISYIRRYFQTGELPPENTTCIADELPFGSDLDDVSAEMLQTRKRHSAINRALHEANGAFMKPALGGRLAAGWLE